MFTPREIVHESFILQEMIGESSYFELWRTSSIFSASNFMLAFLKEGLFSPQTIEAFNKHGIAWYDIPATPIKNFVYIDTFKNRLYIAYEYDGQKSLEDLFKEKCAFPLEHCCRLIVELAQGLASLHKKNLIFHALTAEQVYLGIHGENIETIHIFCPSFSPLIYASDLREPRAVLKNFGYIAPEAKAGASGDIRSDVYSLGVHLFRFLTGKYPCGPKRARSGSVYPYQIAKALAKREVEPELMRITVKALRKNPKNRYQDMAELILDLNNVLDNHSKRFLAAGIHDPLTDINQLNQVGEETAYAVETVRNFNIVEYFNIISDEYKDNLQNQSTIIEPRVFPLYDDDYDENDMEGEEDDDSMSTEAYIDRALISEKSGIQKNSPRQQRIIPQIKTEPDGWSPNFGAAVDPLAKPNPDSDKPAGTHEEAIFSPSSLSWRFNSGNIQDILSMLRERIVKAQHGYGSFEFIEDQNHPADRDKLEKFFNEMGNALYFVDGGNFGVQDSISSFNSNMVALLSALQGSDAMLGHADTIAENKGQSPGTSGFRAEILDMLALIGSSEKPIFIVWRHGELVSKEVHEGLMNLASGIAQLPVVVVIFYRNKNLPAWHILTIKK